MRIFNLMARGDTLSANGQPGPALVKYQQARSELQALQRQYPAWNEKMVAFRLGYLDERITALTKQTAPPPTNSMAATQARAGAGALQVKLLDAGAEPRTLLRLHPKAGDKQIIEVTSQTTKETKAGDTQIQSLKLPPSKMTIEVTVSSVSAEGDIAYDAVVRDAGLVEAEDTTSPGVDELKASLAGLKGMTIIGTMSNRGISQEAKIKTAVEADAKVKQSMEQMKDRFSANKAAFPAEAVGAGAKWEVSSTLASAGVKIQLTETYQITSIEGEHIATKTTVIPHAANQKVQTPALGQMAITLTKLEGNGTGEMSFNLTQLMPTDSTTDVHFQAEMQVNVGGKNQAMTDLSDVHTRLQTK